ncbi:MAG: FAD-dependent oxidoreductase [Hymenobacter sp.]
MHDRAGGDRRREGFDDLMMATGATPVRPALPGVDAPGVFGVQTLDDGVELRAYVTGRKPRRAVIVGGGYIGLEMAEALCALGVETHLVEAAPQPMNTLDPDMGALVAGALQGLRHHPAPRAGGCGLRDRRRRPGDRGGHLRGDGSPPRSSFSAWA